MLMGSGSYTAYYQKIIFSYVTSFSINYVGHSAVRTVKGQFEKHNNP